MSASIFWEPIDPPKHNQLSCSAPSMFIEMLQRAFHSEQPNLNSSDIERLLGMRAATTDMGFKKCLETLVEAIENNKNGIKITILW